MTDSIKTEKAEEKYDLNRLNAKQRESISEFVGEATKSFSTGHVVNPLEQQDAAALRTEFLDDQITTLTWTEGDLSFYHEITKRPSSSSVAQYDVFLKHGKVGHSRFVREMGVAPISDPSIRKKNVNMKFVSDTKQVTIAAGLVDNIADPTRLLTDDGIAVVAKTIEWASFYGDGDLSDNPDRDTGLEFNGLTKLIAEENVLDAKGQSLTEQMLNVAAVTIAKGYGTPTDAYMPIGIQADFVNNQLKRQVAIQGSTNTGTSGFNVNTFLSARGPIALHGSTVMELDNILDEYAIPSQGAPLQPTVEGAFKASVAGSRFSDEDVKSHTYKVVVHSDEAESIASEAETVALTDKAGAIELNIEIQGMYSQRPQFVSIYRQGEETQLFYLIARVPIHKAESGVLKFVDVNETLPETADVFVGEMTPNVIHLFELLPMMRLPLAQQNASVTFSILWYGALALRAPKKWTRIKNVKYIPVTNIFSNF